MPAASPTWAVVMVMPLPALVIVLPTAPTMVTSSPSRIQTVPSPRTIQCHRDQGSRSSRAGTGRLDHISSGPGIARGPGGSEPITVTAGADIWVLFRPMASWSWALLMRDRPFMPC